MLNISYIQQWFICLMYEIIKLSFHINQLSKFD